MKKQSLKPLVTNPTKQSRERYAAFLKEQIYGSFTLLAVNFGLFVKSDLSVKNAFITITTTAIGLWLASMLAAVIAFRVVHDKNMPRKELIHELTIHRGLLVAAVPSLLMFSLAALGLIQIQTAIIAAITLAIVGMTVAILRSAKTSSNSIATAFISIGVQAVAAAVIILIKLGAK
ncbi:MAG: hypothetical protein V4678_04085 [Patescibacteria group bacterium]